MNCWFPDPFFDTEYELGSYDNSRDSNGQAQTIHITAHARKRFAERTNIPDYEILPLVTDAVRWGKTLNDYRGPNLQYMYEKAAGGMWPIAYRGLLMLFSPKDFALVTVYPLPGWFLSNLRSANVKETKLQKLALGIDKGIIRMRNFWVQMCSGKPQDYR